MKRHLIIYIALLLSIVGCRTDDYIVYMEEEDIGIKDRTNGCARHVCAERG